MSEPRGGHEPEDDEDDEDDAPSGPLVVTVPAALARERLDRVIVALVPGASRAAAQRWIEAGQVRLDGAEARASTKAPAGAELEIAAPPPEPAAASPEDIPLTILFEDEHLVVVDKPAGLVVHPAAGHPSGTLVNALLFRYGGLAGLPTRPGIVHRLDKDTSGAMVVARTEAAREGLGRLFAAHDVERSYVAIVAGGPPPRVTYATLHGRHPTDRKRFSARVTRGRRAVTHVEALEDLGGATLVRCVLETGRTHQIRVHLSEHGFAILGDPLYGRAPKDERLRAVARALGRQALHAEVLGLVHPVTGARLRVESRLPDDFALALEHLRR